MKIDTFIILLATIFLSMNLANANKKAGTLIIKVYGFENTEGIMHSHIFNDAYPELFPTKSKDAFTKQSVKVNKNETVVIYENIPYGTYAATVHHDINKNMKLDKNFIGYPAEPFGLSNNPSLSLSIPKFEKCCFKIDKDTVIIKIILKFV